MVSVVFGYVGGVSGLSGIMSIYHSSVNVIRLLWYFIDNMFFLTILPERN